MWVGLVDDPDESTRLLVGDARIVATGFLGLTWHARNLTGIPIAFAPGSQEGVTAAVRSAVRHALEQK